MSGWCWDPAPFARRAAEQRCAVAQVVVATTPLDQAAALVLDGRSLLHGARHLSGGQCSLPGPQARVRSPAESVQIRGEDGT